MSLTIALEHGLTPPTWDLGDFTLRPLKPSDYQAWSEYLACPEVTRHTSWDHTDATSIGELVERYVSDYTTGKSCRWALADKKDRLFGTCGFSTWSREHSHAELVYDLAPAEWRRGFGSLAVRTVLGWTFDIAQFNRVHAFVMDTNAASIALLARVGFEREGLLKQYRMSRGVARDFLVYTFLRDNWPTVE